MEWVLLSLFAAVAMAVQVEANRSFNCNGLQLNFWRATIASVLLVVPALLFPWPDDPLVYGLAIFDGIVSVYACTLLFNLAAQKQSRVSSLYSPLATLVGLLLWLAISEAEQSRLAASPLAGAIILFALGLAAYGLNRFRRNDASWAAFVAVLPVGVIFGCTDVLSRLVLFGHNTLPTIMVFCFCAFVVTSITNGAVLIHRRALVRPDKMMLRGAVVMAISSAVFFVVLIHAILSAPNPAYPGFFIMTMPVMLLAYHKLVGANDDADWRGALLIVAGAVLASSQAVWFN